MDYLTDIKPLELKGYDDLTIALMLSVTTNGPMPLESVQAYLQDADILFQDKNGAFTKGSMGEASLDEAFDQFAQEYLDRTISIIYQWRLTEYPSHAPERAFRLSLALSKLRQFQYTRTKVDPDAETIVDIPATLAISDTQIQTLYVIAGGLKFGTTVTEAEVTAARSDYLAGVAAAEAEETRKSEILAYQTSLEALHFNPALATGSGKTVQDVKDEIEASFGGA